MEVEESTPTGADGFTPVTNGAKRKNSLTLSDDDGQAQENLLGQNKFGALSDKKSKPNPDPPKPNPPKPIPPRPAPPKPTPVVQTPGKTAGKEKLPPLVVKNVDFVTLSQKLDPRPVSKLTRFGIKLLCSSSEEFKAVESQLQKCGMEYYTHDKPSERPYRVVLRGLPLVDTKDLIHRIKKDHGLEAQSAHIIKRKGECAALQESFYLLHFPKGYTNLRKLREIKAIEGIVVRWEAYRNKRADVTQCMNCLYHGHGTRNCHLKSRCNVCGGSHGTDACPTKEAPAKKCANCAGAHSATDRSCPKRAEYIQIRQKVTTANQPGKKTSKKGKEVPDLTEENFPPLTPGPSPTPQPKPKPKPGPKVDDDSGESSSSEEGTNRGLYTAAELWAIYEELHTALGGCKTSSDQVRVLIYIKTKYGVK